MRGAAAFWSLLTERLLGRRGNAVGRAGRLVLFLVVMASIGFGVTLLGMVGLLLIDSIQQRDYPVVQGAVLLIAFSYLLVNTFTDRLYRVIDPRIRRQ